VSSSGSILRAVPGALTTAFLCLCLVATASATQSVELDPSFSPYRLGAPATINLNLQIHAAPGQIPSALTEIEVRYPQNLGFALSGLGLAVCSPAMLAEAGTSGCPADSIMGRGSATAELSFGPQLVTENASISIARAPDQEGHIALLLYASGPSPVNTQILSPAQLLPTSPPFGGRLNMELPVIPSVPGAADIAIASLNVTIGPQGLTYYERTEGTTLAYTPKGILLPKTCPHGGFPFAATFSFLDGSHPEARTTLPCPRRSRSRRRGQQLHGRSADVASLSRFHTRRRLVAKPTRSDSTSARRVEHAHPYRSTGEGNAER
jgi:hypothetical protein